jgi:hypothetical protein
VIIWPPSTGPAKDILPRLFGNGAKAAGKDDKPAKPGAPAKAAAPAKAKAHRRR